VEPPAASSPHAVYAGHSRTDWSILTEEDDVRRRFSAGWQSVPD